MRNKKISTANEPSASKLRLILRKLIADANITDVELARALNMPYSTLNQLLKSDNLKPRVDTLIPIAKYFNVTIEQLMGEKSLSRKNISTQSISTSAKLLNKTWEPDLFMRCLEMTSNIMKSNDYQADAEQVISIIRETYFFSLKNKGEEVNHSFIEWLFENLDN
jgi:transcriptional regulator with XRE-family HTH domain